MEGIMNPKPILVEIAPGELLDKITILEIKNERMTDQAKVKNVQVELSILSKTRQEAMATSAELTDLEAQLKAVNERLWDIEDEIRVCERQQDFGPRFISLARAVYHENDRRAAIKKAINQLLHSRIVEEKSYAAYS
jgi:3-methyladenine DNA glycosylase/8-oxoguanine DNA glycosylase